MSLKLTLSCVCLSDFFPLKFPFLWPCCLEKAVMLQGKSVPDPVSLPHHISIIRATHTHLIISHFPCMAGVLSWIFWGLQWRNSGTFDSTDSHLTTLRPRRADDTGWWWKHIDPRLDKKGLKYVPRHLLT